MIVIIIISIMITILGSPVSTNPMASACISALQTTNFAPRLRVLCRSFGAGEAGADLPTLMQGGKRPEAGSPPPRAQVR